SGKTKPTEAGQPAEHDVRSGVPPCCSPLCGRQQKAQTTVCDLVREYSTDQGGVIAPQRPITTWSANRDRTVQSGMPAASVTLPQQKAPEPHPRVVVALPFSSPVCEFVDPSKNPLSNHPHKPLLDAGYLSKKLMPF